MQPVFPVKCSGKNWTDQTKRRPEVGDELQERRNHSPQWSPRYFQEIETEQPEKTNRSRVLKLCDKPVSKRAARNAKVLSDFHSFSCRLYVSLCGQQSNNCEQQASIILMPVVNPALANSSIWTEQEEQGGDGADRNFESGCSA